VHHVDFSTKVATQAEQPARHRLDDKIHSNSQLEKTVSRPENVFSANYIADAYNQIF
jgi:hypothetical protein